MLAMIGQWRARDETVPFWLARYCHMSWGEEIMDYITLSLLYSSTQWETANGSNQPMRNKTSGLVTDLNRLGVCLGGYITK